MFGILKFMHSIWACDLFIMDTRYGGHQMGFYRPLPYPPIRTGKGWPTSVPLLTYNKGTIKVKFPANLQLLAGN